MGHLQLHGKAQGEELREKRMKGMGKLSWMETGKAQGDYLMRKDKKEKKKKPVEIKHTLGVV